MLSFRRPDSLAFPRWFAMLCLLAVALNSLSTLGMQPLATVATTEFSPPLCTVHGLQATSESLPNPVSPTTAHDCCKQCVGGTPPLALAVATAVSPAPTFGAFVARQVSAAPRQFARANQPPRGPPALV